MIGGLAHPVRVHWHLAGVWLDRHLVRIVVADDHVAGERVAVVHEAVPGLLAGRKAGVVARGHHMGLGADAQGEPALEEKEMLLLEDVPVRWRTLLARRQFLDRHADTIADRKSTRLNSSH